MRCLACNVLLTDFEATRKSFDTDEFIDLCNHCFSFIKNDVIVVERDDLDELPNNSDDEISLD